MNMDQARKEVDQNYTAFRKMLPSIISQHGGQFALMKDRKCVAFFDTGGDAQFAGQKLYGDGKFSIQEVTQGAVDLGWYSRALP